MAVNVEQTLVAIGSTDSYVLFYQISGELEAPRGNRKRRRAEPARAKHPIPDAHLSDGPQEHNDSSDTEDDKDHGTRHRILVPFGSLLREASHRVAHMEFSNNGVMLAVCCAGMLALVPVVMNSMLLIETVWALLMLT
jgi:hypothetical protein